jgi:putative DNA primase/helicase
MMTFLARIGAGKMTEETRRVDASGDASGASVDVLALMERVRAHIDAGDFGREAEDIRELREAGAPEELIGKVKAAFARAKPVVSFAEERAWRSRQMAATQEREAKELAELRARWAAKLKGSAKPKEEEPEEEPEVEAEPEEAPEAEPQPRAVPGVKFGAEPDWSGVGEPAVLSKATPYENAREFVSRRCFREGWLATFWHEEEGDGHWWQWNGCCYGVVSEVDLRGEIWDFLNEARARKEDGTERFRPKSAEVNGVVDGLRSGLNLKARFGCWLDSGKPASEVIAFATGLVEIATGAWRKASPRLWVRGALDFEWKPEARCPRWEQFLEEIFPGDTEAQACVEEQLGYAMTDDYSIQKGAMWGGKPRSGKGTLAFVLRRLVGDEYYAGLSFNTWIKSENSRQPLIGKKVLCFPDVRLPIGRWYGPKYVRGGLDFMSIELLLNIIGGDSVTVARKYVEAWRGLVRGKVFVIFNEPMDLGDDVLPTRFVKTWFGQCFLEREDPHLDKKLATELPGIAVRCQAAYRRLVKRGRFVQPRSAKELEGLILAKTNLFEEFIREVGVIDREATVNIQRAFVKFRDWCQEAGHVDLLRSIKHAGQLSPRLRTVRGLENMGTHREHGEARVWTGWRLKTAKELKGE